MDSHLLPVILAGGSGTRLWPLSRKHYAKQYLSFGDGASMLQETILRLEGLRHGAPLVLCNEETRFLAAEQVRRLGTKGAALLLEPAGRNTAPAIALAALEAMAQGDNPVLLVMPADHKIANRPAFWAAVATGTALAQAGKLVTFGIAAHHPETGYGYIRRGAPDGAAFAVQAFVEKPDATTAQAYIDTGDYYWNSGIFMFEAERYLQELARFRPDILAACRAAFKGRQTDMDFLRFDAAAFLACPAESVDYAVMENTDASVVVPLDAGWSDIGSWSALWDASEKDAQGNCEIGDVLSIESRGNYIHAGSRLVTALGCDDMVIIETKDTVLVAPKQRVQEVKKLVSALKARNRAEVDYHREVFRPWGKYDCIDCGARYQVKRITVNPGARLSVQKHHHRAEHWVVVRGTAMVLRGSETMLLTENESTYIPLGEVHALENPGKVPLELIEVQSGSYLGEDDIVRLDDIYGRLDK